MIFLDYLCPPHAVFTVQLYYAYNQYCAHFANWFSLKKLFERVLKLNLKASGSPYVILLLCLDVSCLPREVTLWRGALVIATSCVYYIWSPTNGVNRDLSMCWLQYLYVYIRNSLDDYRIGRCFCRCCGDHYYSIRLQRFTEYQWEVGPWAYL